MAFDAPRLHPSTCWPFVVFLSESMIIDGQDLDSAMPHALANSSKLGRHSGVYTFCRVDDRLVTKRYVWAHRDFRPWGKALPIQCPVCGTPQRWKRKYVQDDSASAYTFYCRYKDCGRDPVTGSVSHRGQIVVRKPEGIQAISLGKNKCSGWLSVVVR